MLFFLTNLVKNRQNRFVLKLITLSSRVFTYKRVENQNYVSLVESRKVVKFIMNFYSSCYQEDNNMHLVDDRIIWFVLLE